MEDCKRIARGQLERAKRCLFENPFGWLEETTWRMSKQFAKYSWLWSIRSWFLLINRDLASGTRCLNLILQILFSEKFKEKDGNDPVPSEFLMTLIRWLEKIFWLAWGEPFQRCQGSMYWPVEQPLLTLNKTYDSPGALECSVQNLLKGRAFCSTSVPVGPWCPQLGCDQKVITHNDFVGIFKWRLRLKC